MAILNRAYAKDENRQFGPVFLANETYSFYINLDKPTSDPDFDNFRLDLRDMKGNLVQADIGALAKDIVHLNFYNILCTFTFPAGIRFGWYRLAIFDPIKGKTKCLSNPIYTEELQFAPIVARLFFRNETNRNGVNYEGNPDFYNIYTLPLIQTEFNIDTERKQYRNVTNRRLRNLKNYRDEVFKVEAYYFDEVAHKALAEAFDCDTIYLNETFVVPKDAYQIEGGGSSVLSKGLITVIADDTVAHPYPDWALPPVETRAREYTDEYDGEYN